MCGPLLAVAGALLSWLLAWPAHAEQASDPLAALTRAGAPLVAVNSVRIVIQVSGRMVVHSGATPPARPMAASATTPPTAEPGAAPAIGIPGIPSPSDL